MAHEEAMNATSSWGKHQVLPFGCPVSRVGRNEPRPCRSGRKFKNHCLLKEDEAKRMEAESAKDIVC